MAPPANLREFCTLDFRVARQPDAPPLNAETATNFSLRLIYRSGPGGPTPGPVALALRDYLNLSGPAGGGPGSDPHAVLQTVRIPLADFAATDLSNVHGLQLIFDDIASGAIYLADMRYERACN